MDIIEDLIYNKAHSIAWSNTLRDFVRKKINMKYQILDEREKNTTKQTGMKNYW